MATSNVKEWFIDSVFGKVAMTSWGLGHHPPVLLVHGYMDTAATFIPLLEELPDTHFYVGFDFPGHGKSCRLPVGPAPSPAVFVETMRAVVDSLGWDEFVLMGHSVGGVVGFFYNYFYPSKISRMVLLDPLLPLSYYYYLTHEPATWYSFFYDEYYLEFKKNYTQGRLFTYEQAVKMVMSSRDISRKTAEVLLARALVSADGNLFRFSSQLIVKRMSLFPIQEDLLFHTLTTNQPPILSLVALGTKNNILPEINGFSKKILKVLGSQKNTLVFVEGNHDVHLSTPKELAPFIEDYFNQNKITTNSFTAKL